jgi:pimeloyl-ACP methyl ester carboxylesterase
MDYAISKDGTRIAYERLGSGPALILVDGALCSRAFGPMPKLAPLLAGHFTVFMYDRRGRGESGNTEPYDPGREVDDIAALLAAAGGTAFAVGLSSGAALVLRAAAEGLPLTRIAAYEPPYIEAENSTRGTVHQSQLDALIAKGDRAGAVKYFMGPMVMVPAPIVFMMQLMPWVWSKLKAVAHTLPHDAAVMGDFRVPSDQLGKIRTPALLMHGSKTPERLQRAALTAAKAVPGAQHKVLPGQTHNVSNAVLVPALLEFFET